MFSGKRFAALIVVTGIGITGSLAELELPLCPRRTCRTLHALVLRHLTGAGEYMSRKTGHFVCRERLGAALIFYV